MPQHINNSLEFEALKTNASRKKIHKSKKKKEEWGKIPIDAEWKNIHDLACVQIQRQIIRKTAYPNEGGGWESLRP